MRRMFAPAVVLLTLLQGSLLSCNDITLGQKDWKDSFLQSTSLSVDVLFVVDNSLSMQGEGQEQERVKQAFGDFVVNLEANKSDFHIGVTTTDLDHDLDDGGTQGRLKEFEGVRYITSDMDPVTYQNIFNQMINNLGDGSGWEKGLWAAKLCLDPESEGGNADGWNTGFLRDDAKLAIIFVSDEDDCSDEGNPLEGEEQAECYTHANELRPVFEYVADYQMLKEHDEDVLVSAIVGPKGVSNDTECGANTSAGTRYMNAVDAFGGITGNICDSNFSSILSEMGLSAAGIRTHFALSRTPNPDSISVLVNEVEIPSSDGWAYDAVSNAIDFYGDAVPPRDSVILITYHIS